MKCLWLNKDEIEFCEVRNRLPKYLKDIIKEYGILSVIDYFKQPIGIWLEVY